MSCIDGQSDGGWGGVGEQTSPRRGRQSVEEWQKFPISQGHVHTHTHTHNCAEGKEGKENKYSSNNNSNTRFGENENRGREGGEGM